MKYFPALDGIRGISILLVVLFHFGLLDMGWIGVEIFFVLSGFLITRILREGREWPLGFYLKRFYWRRILRIFPVYFGFLLLVTGVYALTGYPKGTLDYLPYLATYTFNIAMEFMDWNRGLPFHYLWSLSLEEQFYLIWPILMFILPRKGAITLCVAIILLSPLMRFLLAEYLIGVRGSKDLVGGVVYYFPLGQLDTFATGGLLALLGLEKYVKRPLRLWAFFTGIALLAGLANLWVFLSRDADLALNSFGYPVSSLAQAQHVWSYTLINLSAGSLILLAVHPEVAAGGFMRRVLDMGWLRRIGIVSYGMYVIHWPMQMVLERFVRLEDDLLIRWLQFLPFMLLLWWASHLSYRYFESRFLRLKTSRFHPPPKKTPQ